MIINKYFAILFVCISLVSVLSFSLIPAFYEHLRVDIYGEYINHVNVFLRDGNLSNIGYNEYQPVAVMFFISLSPFYKLSNNDINTYIYGLYFVNILLAIIACFLIYALKKNYTNIFIFALIFLFTGPIILNRFELLVFVELLLMILFYTKKRYFWSGTFMSIAIATKIYPIIFLPYMFYLVTRNRTNYKDVIRYIAGITFGILLVLYVFCGILGVDYRRISSDAKIHSIKPVNSESVWSTLLVFFHWFKNGNHAIGGGSFGVWGIQEELILLPKLFYNYFWILAVTIYYLYILLKNYSSKKVSFDPAMLYLFALLFMVTSKIITPQYILWFSLPFTLITIPMLSKKQLVWSLQLGIILLTSVLTQFVYPLNYGGYLRFFEKQDNTQFYFWVMALRNMLLIALLFVGWATFRIKKGITYHSHTKVV